MIRTTTALTRRARFAALGATLLAATAVAGCAAGGDPDADALRLDVPGTDVAAICAELSADTLTADVAFRGVVVSIDGDEVALDVERAYAGDIPSRVILPQQPAALPSELSIGAFSEGGEYLIAAQDGWVLTCGQSGPSSPELEAVYDAAF